MPDLHGAARRRGASPLFAPRPGTLPASLFLFSAPRVRAHAPAAANVVPVSSDGVPERPALARTPAPPRGRRLRATRQQLRLARRLRPRPKARGPAAAHRL